jgi:hypothetical protein
MIVVLPTYIRQLVCWECVGPGQHDHAIAHTTRNKPERSMLLWNNLIWRARRVPRASSSTCIIGRQQLVRSQHLRLLGIVTVSGGTGNATSTNIFALALGGITLTLGGYYVGARSNPHAAVNASKTPSYPLKAVYGTPEDFACAIEEFKTMFPEEAVTTAEDQLSAHGLSNTHLPGTCISYPSQDTASGKCA